MKNLFYKNILPAFVFGLIALNPFKANTQIPHPPGLYWTFDTLGVSPWEDWGPNNLDLNVLWVGNTISSPGQAGNYFHINWPNSPECNNANLLNVFNDSLEISWEFAVRFEGNDFARGFVLNLPFTGYFAMNDISLGGSVYLVDGSARTVEVVFNGTSRKDPEYYFDGNWHHIALTFNQSCGMLKIYVDGICPEGFSQDFGPGPAIAHPYGSMGISWQNDPGVGVDLDEVAIYNEEIPSTFVWQHFVEFSDSNHYSFTDTTEGWEIPTPNEIAENAINIFDFATSYPNVPVPSLALLRRYQGARYLPRHNLPRINPWITFYNVLAVDSFTIFNPNTPAAYQNGALMAEELSKNYFHAFHLGHTDWSANPLIFSNPNDYPFYSVPIANANPQYPRFLMGNWAGMNPARIGHAPLAEIVSEIHRDTHPSNFYLYNNPNSFTPPLWKYPLSPAMVDSLLWDGRTHREFALRWAAQLSNGRLNILGENDEMIGGLDSVSGLLDNTTLADYQAFVPSVIPDWDTYQSWRRTQLKLIYRDVWRNYADSTNNNITNVVWYNVWGAQNLLLDYDSAKYVNTVDTLGFRRPTVYFYPQFPGLWRYHHTHLNSWDRLVFGMQYQFQAGDSLMQPFVSPGIFATPGFSTSDRNMIRPGEWLGLMKGLGMLGADTYNIFDFWGGPGSRGNWRTWTTVIPAYAQGISSRLEEFIHNGRLLRGDSLNSNYGNFHRQFTFGSQNPNDLVLVRKVHGQERYAITAIIPKIGNNSVSIGDKERDLFFVLHDDGVNNSTDTIRLGAREQGSSYILDRTNPISHIFYQLDKWHEWSEPMWWCQDLNFEAEVYDSVPSNSHLKTDLPPGATTGDYRDFTTYVGFTGSWAQSPVMRYTYLGRSANQRYLWVRARSKVPQTTSFKAKLNTGNYQLSSTVQPGPAWQWYSVPLPLSPFIPNAENILEIIPTDNKIEIDQIVILRNNIDPDTFQISATYQMLPNDTVCIGDTITFDMIGQQPKICERFEWDFGDGMRSYEMEPRHAWNRRGEFNVFLHMTEQCTGVAFDTAFKVTVIGPIVDAGEDVFICPGDTVQLAGFDSLASTHNWSPNYNISSTAIYNPFVWPDTSVYYVLSSTDAIGCSAMDSVEVCVIHTDLIVNNGWQDINIEDDIDTVYSCGGLDSLTVSGGFHVLWQPGNLVSDSTAWTVFVNLNTNTTLTVIGWDANACSFDTAQVQVFVLPQPTVNILTPDTTLCSPDSLQLSSIANPVNVSFLWLPVSGLSAINISNPVAGIDSSITYFLTVTDSNGCTASDSINIYALPIPGITMNDTSICAGDSIQLTASGGGTYQWSNPCFINPINTANPWLNPIQNGCYQVTVTSTMGCTKLDTICVDFDTTNCCWVSGTDYVLSNQNTAWMISCLNGGSANFINKDFMVNGTLTVDVNTFFTNCNFYMMPFSQIVVTPGDSLSLNGCNLTDACDTIWEGMRLAGNNSRVRINNSTVANARNAVSVALGARYWLTGSTFHNDWRGLVIDPAPFVMTAQTGIVHNCDFTCTPPLLFNAQNTRTRRAIDIGNNRIVTIGDQNSPINLNHFNGVMCGIFSNRSTVTVTNCEFNTLAFLAGIPESGTGVYFQGNPSTFNPPNTLTAGTAIAPARHNYFYNLRIGIHTQLRATVRADYNIFNNITERGVSVTNNFWTGVGSSPTVNINQNSITSALNGIYVFNTRMSSMLIEYNTITNPPAQNPVGINLQTVQSPDTITFAVSVRANNITLHGRGIYLLNCRKVHVRSCSLLVNVAAPIQTKNHFGILVENGNNNRLLKNTCWPSVNNNNTYTNTLAVRGIQVKTSPNVILECNNVQRHGRSFVFDGVNTPTKFFYNIMGYGVRGLVLSGGGRIGNQGSTGTPSGNRWLTNGNSFGIPNTGGESFVELSIAPASALFVYQPENVVGTLYHPSPNFSAGGPALITPNSTNPRDPNYCSNSNFPPAIQNPQNELLLVAQNQLQFNQFPQENEWKTKAWLFEALETDSVLRNSHPAFISSFNTLQNTNKAEFFRIRTQGNQGNISQARSMNNNLNPGNLIEHNLKTANGIFFDTYAVDSVLLDSVEISTLYSIAIQCPEIGGEGVHIARSMLTMQGMYSAWPDSCSEEFNKMEEPNPGNVLNSSRIIWNCFPNPVRSTLYIQVASIQDADHLEEQAEITITNLLGLIVFYGNVAINGPAYEVPVDAWSSGLYVVRVKVGGDIEEFGRVAVVK